MDGGASQVGIREVAEWAGVAPGDVASRLCVSIQARVHLQSALDVFESLGAAPWQLRAQSQREPPARPRQSPQPADPSDLNPQELEIALLGATGLTDRRSGVHPFISPRTIGAHLYRIFPKLGIVILAGLRA